MSWSPALVELADRALNSAKPLREGGNTTVDGQADVCAVDIGLEFAVLDNLPPGVRWALNYAVDNHSAAALLQAAARAKVDADHLSVNAVAAVLREAPPRTPNPFTRNKP